MKIDRIAITSLASLRGEQPVIDLAAGELADAGLVAITGATGAGKSTILDAVCLSLFDRTPRLDSASQAQELLTRGAGEGHTEIDLTLDDGRRWTIEWSIHRARQQPAGALQPSRRRILDRTTGEIVAEGKRDVSAAVEAALGLTFEQFTGVILLAQGDFAKFLSATDSQRSALLERLTGTEIYSDLGRLAFERHKEMRGRLQIENQQLSRLVLLEPSERFRLEHQLDALEPTLTRLEAQLQDVDAQLQWLVTRARLEARATTSAERLDKAERQLADAAGDHRRLTLAERATALAPPLLTVETARRGATEARDAERAANYAEQRSAAARATAVATLARCLAALHRAIEQAEAEVEAERGFAGVSAEALAAWLQTRRELSSARAEAEQRAANAAAAVEQRQRHVAEREAAEHQLTTSTAAHAALNERLAASQHRRDEMLQGETVAGWVERRVLFERAAQVRAQLDTLDLEASGLAVSRANAAHQSASADAEASRVLVQAARRELADHDTVLRLAVIGADLAEHRQHLVIGEPCPLCGALTHPLAEAGGAETSGHSALHRAEARREALRRELTQAESGFDEADSRRRQAQQEVERAEQQLATDQRNRQQHDAQWVELSFRLPDLPPRPDESSASALEARRDAIAERLQQIEAMDGDDAELRHDLEAAADAMASARRQRDLAHERLHHAEQQVTATGRANQEAEVKAEALRHGARDQGAELASIAGLPVTAIDDLDTLQRTLEAGRRRLDEAIDRRRRLARLHDRWGERATDHLDSDRPELGAADHGPADAATLDRNLREALGAADRHHDSHRHDRQHHDYTTNAKDSAEVALEAAEATWRQIVQESPFDDEAAVRAALLEPADIEALRQRLEALRLEAERRRAEHGRSTADLDEHHVAAAACGIDLDTDIEGLERRLSTTAHDLRTRIGTAHERRTALRVQLEQDDQRRHERMELEAAVGNLDAECRRAGRLADLIGQKDGGKFRRFAQQLNLDQLLALANRRLDRLAPRYALDRLENSLDLEVVDRDMADERRPISTLSGGESFLVSLALALGLADLRRGQLQLGTLFLDEGFGSLDQDTLDTALSTLEQLQADQSTQILVISHVGALQERIPHRIEVLKRGGGSSRLRVRIGD